MSGTFEHHKLKTIGILILIGMLILVLAGAWKFTPLSEHADRQAIAGYIESIRHAWWTPLFIVFAYALVHALLFPNTILNAAVLLTIGGFRGWIYAIGASLTSATLYFFLGRRFGAVGMHAIEGKNLDRVRNLLRKGRFGSVALVRLAPIAPYTVVNTLAGAIKLRYPDFIIGTFLAHLPGSVTLAVLQRQLSEVIVEPGPGSIAVLAAVVVIGILVFALLRRYAGHHVAGVQ